MNVAPLSEGNVDRVAVHLSCHEVTGFQFLGGIVWGACSSNDKSWCRRWSLLRGGLWTAAAAISDLWPLQKFKIC